MISSKGLAWLAALAAASQLSAKSVNVHAKPAKGVAEECLAHEIGGYVSRLDKAGQNDRRRDPLPRRARDHDAGVALNEGDMVCGLDVISVSTNSPWIAVISLSGAAPLVVKPGETKQVPKPTAWGAAQALKTRFDQLFQSRATDRASASRRMGPDDGVKDPDPKAVMAVREWGPLMIAWPMLASHRDRTLTIRADGKTKTVVVSGDFIRLDLAHDCPRECVLSAVQPEGAMDQDLRVRVVSQNTAPRPDWLGQVTRPEHLALEGGWLLQQDSLPQWSLQAESALWVSSCSLPVVLEPLRQRYFEVDAHQACATAMNKDSKSSRRRNGG